MLPTVLIIYCCITNWTQIEWLKITAIIYFSHGSAIWAGLSRNSFSLLQLGQRTRAKRSICNMAHSHGWPVVLTFSSKCSCKVSGFGFSPHRLLLGAAWASSQHGSRVLSMSISSDRERLQVSWGLSPEMSFLPYSISQAITNPSRFKGSGHRCHLWKGAVWTHPQYL